MSIPRCLVTDLDGTLVGHSEGLVRLVRLLEERRPPWHLVYATGRTLDSARALAAREGLPAPDVWITEVGAAITDRSGRPDEAWRERIAHRWVRERVKAAAEAMPELRPQPDEAQGPFKVSYYLDSPRAHEVLEALDKAIRSAGVEARLVYSSGMDLDIVPAAAGKGEAVRHVLARLRVPLEHSLTCGDSGNDHDMLSLGGPAVVVANAKEELLRAGLPESVLRARGACAEGIIEALHHFRWLEDSASLSRR